MFLKFIILLFYTSFVCSQQQFNYEEQNNWAFQFPESTCGGRRQSPINIDTNRLRRNPNLRLNVESYDIPHRNVILHNTGHTAELSLKSRNPTMNIGVNGEPYVFQNMHFHWGDNNFKGTEHSVDNGFGAEEIHFVHFNQKYGNFSAAGSQRDGIVVVTVLVQLSRQDNRALEPIIRRLPQIISINASEILPKFTFGRLLPQNTDIFFSYPGSLTTPPCSETVTFMIFADPIRISAIQLSQFRRLFEDSDRRDGQKIISNTRNLQKINGRIVEVSVPRSPYGGRPRPGNRPREFAIAEPTFNEQGNTEDNSFDY